MFSVAGLIAEVRIAGYPTGYVEVDVAGRTSIAWDAIRVARIEACLPICGHKDCEIPFDTERIAEVIQRAEDEVFVMLQANWPVVQRVVRTLCKRDRITSLELDDLITGKRRGQRQRSKRKLVTQHDEADTSRVASNDGLNIDKTSNDGSSKHEPTLIGDAA
jgi:hypothetical protein